MYMSNVASSMAHQPRLSLYNSVNLGTKSCVGSTSRVNGTLTIRAPVVFLADPGVYTMIA